MTPPMEIARDWQARLTRCRHWADLLRADPAGGRLAALAHEIEQGIERLKKSSTPCRRLASTAPDFAPRLQS
jgi:hypothetical protein